MIVMLVYMRGDSPDVVSTRQAKSAIRAHPRDTPDEMGDGVLPPHECSCGYWLTTKPQTVTQLIWIDPLRIYLLV